MEMLFVLAGMVLLLLPVVAFLMAFNTRKRVQILEKNLRSVQAELLGLRVQMGGKSGHEFFATQSSPVSAPGHASAPTRTPSDEASRSEASGALHGDKAEPATQAVTAGAANWDTATSVLPTPSADERVAKTPVATFPPIKLASPSTPSARPMRAKPRLSVFDTPWFLQAKTWLLGGNVVAKIGLLILFFGVSFLLKYVAAQVTVPIELRLAAVALADIALLVWAWRIRLRRPEISLPVQGAALAILMLVTFAAFRLYQLIPSGLAFVLLFMLTLFTCVLAVLQNALWLAVFGIAGGFAAPVLTSTGHGSYIALFSYYALLNAGVLAIALLRSWRLLNVVAFAFTFLIGTAWGVTQYAPENYLPAQLFLVLFFVMYVAIALLFAQREAPQLKKYVDATVVFGTPLAAFGLQYGLVRDLPFGLAFSALALGSFYVVLSLVLWNRRGSSLRLLVESFLALGVVFATLTIPFALDGRWTSAAWALEGAGIVWVGLRQRQTMTWLFGLLVQAGAWLSFLGSVAGLNAGAAARSNLWLGFLFLAGTAFLMATNFRRHASSSEQLTAGVGDAPKVHFKSRFAPLSTAFLALAAIWFIAGAWTEIFLRTDGVLQADLIVVSALIIVTALGLIAKRMQWVAARVFAVAVQIVAGLVLLGVVVLQLDWPVSLDGVTASDSANLLSGPFLSGLLMALAALFSARFLRVQADPAPQFTPLWSRTLSWGLLSWAGFWWFAVVLVALTGWAGLHYQLWLDDAVQDSVALAAYAIGVAASAWILTLLAVRLRWADLRWVGAISWAALALLTLWLVAVSYASVSAQQGAMPAASLWLAYAVLWFVGERLMREWQGQMGWGITATWLKILHVVRGVGLWMLIWPVGATWITHWLQGEDSQQAQLLADAGWFTSGSWARYLPAWAMMGLLAWVMRRSNIQGMTGLSDGGERWPVKPLARWYRTRMLPLGVAWSLLLVVIWNLRHSGVMAPLPYVPLLNPLDLSTGFAMMLGVLTYRMLLAERGRDSDNQNLPPAYLQRAPLIAGVAAYGWFNLMLLRTVANYGGIQYSVDALFDSQFVQAMLSLVWSATALILMWLAVRKSSPPRWMAGAGLLALVVAKLFLVDLSNVGGVARIVSFVGVGLLMVAIGYLAPYPAGAKPLNPNDAV